MGTLEHWHPRLSRQYLCVAIFSLLLPAAFITILPAVGTVLDTLLLLATLTLLTLRFVRGWVRRDFNLFEPVIVTCVILGFAYPLQVLYISLVPEHTLV